jgi:hypothetical protein
MTVSVSVRGIDELRAFFAALPAALRKIVVPTVSTYLIGDDSHGLKHLVKYRYVSRSMAYSPAYKNDRQHAKVMALLRERGWDGKGPIPPYQRTGELVAGWHYTLQGGGYGAKIENSAPGAAYVFGDDTQANQLRLVGHRTISSVISTNINGAIQAANQAIQRWINSHGD